MQDAIATQWWGHSKEHGWVVLDRTIPSNAPGIKDDLMFVRCRDVQIYSVKRENWRPPSYRFAPNYIRDLAASEVDAATAELDGLMARWPEFEGELQRDRRETEERAEAVRVQEEKDRKRAASEKRKLAAAAKA